MLFHRVKVPGTFPSKGTWYLLLVLISLYGLSLGLKPFLGGLDVILFYKRQNFGRYQIIFAIIATFQFFSSISVAINTSFLPEGIYSPTIRYGNISGLDQRYNEKGSLVSLTDANAIELNAKTLSKFNSQVQNLITSLNRFGAFKIGDALNLGTLEIQSSPQIQYAAPILAKGITNSWTLAVALPVVHYKNRVQLSQSFSNINYYRQEFSGLSTDLDKALETNLGESTQQVLQDKGYRRLEDRDSQFLGDIQLVSLYKLYDRADWTLILQSTLTLPTGPSYDPDDLLALNNTFHKTSLENSIALLKWINPSWKLIPYVSLKYTLPEKINMRVPEDEDDILPNQDTTESVTRKDGIAYEFGLQNAIDISDSFQISLDYRIGTKNTDKFLGDRNSRYDLLEKDTLTRWQKTALEFTYSTIKSYFRSSSSIPFIASINFFDTIGGANIERRFGQEISFTLFF